jgi:prepilin-type processing-associated H-X9-DG protein
MSNTIFLGEKRLNLQLLGKEEDDDASYITGFDHDTVRLGGSALLPLPDLNDPASSTQDRMGSSHTGGFNVVMGDGSVHFVTYSVSASAWQAAITRASGETAPLD